jgi:putative sigma-54 modulation protein
MQINISFKHMDASEAVRSYAIEQTKKLEKYFRGRTSVAWNFVVEKQNQVAHCHLVGNNMDYFGEGSTQDMYASIDVAIDRIEKQLRKHKEIVKGHLHTDRSRIPQAS